MLKMFWEVCIKKNVDHDDDNNNDNIYDHAISIIVVVVIIITIITRPIMTRNISEVANNNSYFRSHQNIFQNRNKVIK